MAQEPFQLQRAAEADVDLILTMIREMAASEQRGGVVTVTRESLERSVFGARPLAEVYLGYWEGDPVAYLMLQTRFSSYAGAPILMIEDVFVRARAQGRGLGRKLMAYSAGIAKQRGCAAMNWSVGDWNAPALAFNDRLGGAREKGRVHYEMQGAALAALAAEAPR